MSRIYEDESERLMYQIPDDISSLPEMENRSAIIETESVSDPRQALRELANLRRALEREAS